MMMPMVEAVIQELKRGERNKASETTGHISDPGQQMLADSSVKKEYGKYVENVEDSDFLRLIKKALMQYC